MDPRKLAKSYEQEVLPEWDERFAPFVLEAFPDTFSSRCTLLETGCLTGRMTTEIIRRTPPTTRLIAVEDNRDLLEQARRKIPEEDRKRVFFKKEDPRRLSFAEATFDGALSACIPPAYRLEEVLAEIQRLLVKDGFALLGTPLRGSFQEVLDVYREVLEKEDLVAVQEELDAHCQRLPDRLQAGRMLSRAGLVEGRIHQRQETVRFADTLSLVSSALVRTHCLDALLELVRDRGWREGVLAGMIRALDTYFPGGVEVTLVMGRLEATKP